jgi:hypothetical protein
LFRHSLRGFQLGEVLPGCGKLGLPFHQQSVFVIELGSQRGDFVLKGRMRPLGLVLERFRLRDVRFQTGDAALQRREIRAGLLKFRLAFIEERLLSPQLLVRFVETLLQVAFDFGEPGAALLQLSLGFIEQRC